ncbi:hypothetical protein ES332_A10G123700v1 [Gossypium tomentosum]|uniref:Uncharacterized protein n=1 Tax=Gossypium tomentosum TaxID=34277 RepID=A0A5D2NS76_GOSTO|nr:hypothetical protein ES332_A10G123700v1 [Gossypium tomentosum]
MAKTNNHLLFSLNQNKLLGAFTLIDNIFCFNKNCWTFHHRFPPLLNIVHTTFSWFSSSNNKDLVYFLLLDLIFFKYTRLLQAPLKFHRSQLLFLLKGSFFLQCLSIAFDFLI